MLAKVVFGMATILLVAVGARADEVYYDYAPVSWVEPVTRMVSHDRERVCTDWDASGPSPDVSDTTDPGDDGGAGVASIADALDARIQRARDAVCAFATVTSERVVAYRVGYVYAGEEYVRMLDRDPGNRIRVKVSLEARP